MKKLQSITLSKVVLCSPNMAAHKDEVEVLEHVKEDPQGRSWLFCNSLNYTIADSGNFIVITYTMEDSGIEHTIVTNDIFYIDMI